MATKAEITNKVNEIINELEEKRDSLQQDLDKKKVLLDSIEDNWQMMETFMKAIRHPVFVQDEIYQQAILTMVTKMHAYHKDLKQQFNEMDK